MAKYRPSSEIAYDGQKGWYDIKTGKPVKTKGEAKVKAASAKPAPASVKIETKGRWLTPKNASTKIPKPPASYKPPPGGSQLEREANTPMAKALRNAKPDPELVTVKIGEPELAHPKVKAPDMSAPAAKAAAPVAEVTKTVEAAATHQAGDTAFHGLFRSGSKLAKGARAVGGLAKQAAGYAAFGAVQDAAEDEIKRATGFELNSNVSSFINGSVPEYLLTAGTKLMKLRSALLWGAGSVILDYLTNDEEATKAAERAQQIADGNIMPETLKAKNANDKLNAIIQRAENERAMAHGVIPDGRGTSLVGVTEQAQKIAELLNKSEQVRRDANADAYENPTGQETPEEIVRNRKAWKERQAERRTAINKVTAQQMAAAHQARIDKIANVLSGGRMAAIRKAYGASAKLNAETARNAKKMKPRKTGFGNTPTPYQHKDTWIDKNGKVYHRRISLPDLQRRQTQSLDKYRK